jgi:hypothetical protein
MDKRLLLWFLLLTFLAASCTTSQPQSSQDVSAVTRFVRSGTLGLDVQFQQNLPPPQIYDATDLITLLNIKNLGSQDLTGNQCFIQLGGFDPSIIRGINSRQLCGEITGKDVYNLEGGTGVVEFSSNSIRLPRDVDLYNPTLVATACYQYKTVASPQVCVDPNFFELTSDQKACEVRDFGLGGGQGAPVAVTFVNVDMVGSRAVFNVDIANVGGGRVISPRASLSQCPVGLRYNQFDEVRYTVELQGARLVHCTPKDFISRLTNGRGKIVCTFDIGNTQAYETPLRIELNYNYMQSIRKSVEIIRTPN